MTHTHTYIYISRFSIEQTRECLARFARRSLRSSLARQLDKNFNESTTVCSLALNYNQHHTLLVRRKYPFDQAEFIRARNWLKELEIYNILGKRVWPARLLITHIFICTNHHSNSIRLDTSPHKIITAIMNTPHL